MKKIVLSIITLILIFGISACNFQEVEPLEYLNGDNPIEIVYSESLNFSLLGSSFQQRINNSELDNIVLSIEDEEIAKLENGNSFFDTKIVGLKDGDTNLKVTYRNFNRSYRIVVSGIPLDQTHEESGVPVFSFDASDNSGVNSRIITLEGSRVSVNVFHTPIGVETRYEVDTMDIDNPFTVILPGIYTFEYEDADGEIVEEVTYTILAPEIRNPLGFNNNPIEDTITITSLHNYLRGRVNGESLNLSERMEFKSFGKYEIEIYFIDYQDNERILEKFEFNVEPEINVSLSENELIEVQRPLKIQFLNEIQEIYVNDSQVSLNPQGEYIVRQTGLNRIEIRGLGGVSRIYLISYTNEIINDFNRYWFAILPLTIISIGTISFKLLKGIRK